MKKTFLTIFAIYFTTYVLSFGPTILDVYFGRAEHTPYIGTIFVGIAPLLLSWWLIIGLSFFIGIMLGLKLLLAPTEKSPSLKITKSVLYLFYIISPFTVFSIIPLAIYTIRTYILQIPAIGMPRFGEGFLSLPIFFAILIFLLLVLAIHYFKPDWNKTRKTIFAIFVLIVNLIFAAATFLCSFFMLFDFN